MRTKAVLMITLFIGISISSMAQDNNGRFGVELNVGGSFATDKLADAKLNPGFGAEFLLHYRIVEHTGVYAGWGWNKFNAENSFAGQDMDFEETGYVFGVQFKHPLGQTPLNYYLRLGGLYNHIEIENTEGEIVADSKHGLGFQLAGGIHIKLNESWSITPGVKFHYLPRETDYPVNTTDLNLNYVSLRIGIVKTF